VRIPSGDLAPARRGRRRGYSASRYGRRRSRALPVLLAVACVAAVGGGAWALRRDDGAAPDRLSSSPTPTACPSAAATAPAPTARPAAPVVLPAPGQVTFRLLNGTPRDGLGRTVGDALAARGFRVKSTGNAPKALAGASRVYFGPGGRPGAQLVAIHVIGAVLSPVPNAPKGAIDVVLGTGFVRLRTPAEVTSFAARVRAGTAPVAAPAATVVPTPCS
jgi:hypothetical protein